MRSLADWLERLGLAQYCQVFIANDIDLEVMPRLSEQDLERLGVSMGHRKKLLQAAFAISGEAALFQGSGDVPAAYNVPNRTWTYTGERRQLTVLFCDMVGFTALASRLDPEELQEVVRSYEDACAACITRYEGYLYQRLGDGIVAFFGFPTAHEDEAQRAIHAGLAIVDSVPRLELAGVGPLSVRIGIASGLVVVSSPEKGAVGETVNLAARLQGIAPTNGILVSEAVRRMAAASFSYENLGERALKGIPALTPVYRVVGPGLSSRFAAATSEGLTPIVGRKEEIAILLGRWEQARLGEGQVVLLSGEAGIGKSRILNAVREALATTHVDTMHFQCSPHHTTSALYPIIRKLEEALEFGQTDSAQSKLDKVKTLFTFYGLPREDVHLVASLLSIPCDSNEKRSSWSPQQIKDQTLRCLVDLAEAAARKRPAVMMFEDAHWADRSSLDLLDLLIDRVSRASGLVLISHRPEFNAKWTSRSHVAAFNLSRLTVGQSRSIVNAICKGKTLPADLAEQILAKTDGVPLYVEELTKSILDSGDVSDAGDHYEYAAGRQSARLPASLRDSLTARLDRHDSVLEIAQSGAVIGRDFSHMLIHQIVTMAPDALDAGLHLLVDSGLAFRRGTPPDCNYTFKHALVRDAAYDSLLKSRRKELHGRVARALEKSFSTDQVEPQLLAQHYQESGDFVPALKYWSLAGDRSAASAANVEAAIHYRAALSLLSSVGAAEKVEEKELALQMRLGNTLGQAHGFNADDMKECFRRAMLLAHSLGDVNAYVSASVAAGGALIATGYLTQVKELFEPLLAHERAKLSRRSEASMSAIIGISELLLGEISESWISLSLAVKHIDLSFSARPQSPGAAFREVNALAYASLAATYQGRMRESHDLAAKALKLSELDPHGAMQPYARCSLAAVLLTVGDRKAAATLVGEALELAERLGLRPWIALSRIYAGLLHVYRGDAERGALVLDEEIVNWQKSQGIFHSSEFAANAAQAFLRLDLPQPARHFLELGESLIQKSQERHYASELLRIRGRLVEGEGDVEQAMDSYRRATEIARTQGATLFALRSASDLVHLQRAESIQPEYEILEGIYRCLPKDLRFPELTRAEALLHSDGPI